MRPLRSVKLTHFCARDSRAAVTLLISQIKNSIE